MVNNPLSPIPEEDNHCEEDCLQTHNELYKKNIHRFYTPEQGVYLYTHNMNWTGSAKYLAIYFFFILTVIVLFTLYYYRIIH